MGGGKGGGGSVSVPKSPYEEALARIATGLYNQTSGMRGTLTDQANAFLSGRMQPQDMPQFSNLYAIGKQGLESQYGVARDQIMGNMARGGQLNSALKDLSLTRASQVGALPQQISQGLIGDLQNKVYGTAWGAPSQSMSGLGMANQGWTSRANTAAMIEQQQQQANASAFGALGRGLGMLAFGKPGK